MALTSDAANNQYEENQTSVLEQFLYCSRYLENKGQGRITSFVLYVYIFCLSQTCEILITLSYLSFMRFVHVLPLLKFNVGRDARLYPKPLQNDGAADSKGRAQNPLISIATAVTVGYDGSMH